MDEILVMQTELEHLRATIAAQAKELEHAQKQITYLASTLEITLGEEKVLRQQLEQAQADRKRDAELYEQAIRVERELAQKERAEWKEAWECANKLRDTEFAEYKAKLAELSK